MTDSFEEAVRAAAQGLPGAEGESPSYHDAWQRGRRRRLVKRSALAAASAVVLVAALAIGLDRIPGPGATETDEVVMQAEAPTAVPTTEAVATVPAAPTPRPTAIEVPSAAFSTDDESDADPSLAPTATPEPALQATPIPAPTTAPAVPTATPAPSSTTSPDPTARPTSTEVPFATADAEATPTPAGVAGTEAVPPDPEASIAGTGPVDEPPNTAATTARSAADAVILGDSTVDDALACDISGNGVADARCKLFPDYPCSGQGDVRGGYDAVDTDGDDVPETCRAVGLTTCDTTGDGQGDTPCVIEISDPTPAPPQPPAPGLEEPTSAPGPTPTPTALPPG